MGNLRDCIYGQAVGDALGVPYEFNRRGTFACSGMTGFGTHYQPAGTWSDDTSMALAICDSYKQLKAICISDIQQKFINWFKDGSYTCDGVFDIGNTTSSALITGRGCADEYSNGNGSLMRCVPLAFTDATDDEIESVSAITHAHSVSKKACVKMVAFARELIAGATPIEVVKHYFVNPHKEESEIKSGGYVEDTFEASLWCLANTSNYKDCVLKAVNLGDDTDTTGAVTGALAGIVYGYKGIPKNWLKKLRGKQIIENCLF